MMPTIVATAEQVSMAATGILGLTGFADIQLLLDEQAHQREDADISSENAVCQMYGAYLSS